MNMILKLDNEKYSQLDIERDDIDKCENIFDENIDHYLNIFDKIHTKKKLNRISKIDIEVSDEEIEENEEEELYEEEEEIEEN